MEIGCAAATRPQGFYLKFTNLTAWLQLSPYAATEHAAGPAASLFSLAMVNPRAGLDPAVQAIEQTRP